MTILITLVHLVVSIALILVILLQAGKGADLGAMLGGAGAHTLFGGSGATSFLAKLTTVVAVVFMITCLTLAFVSSHSGSVTSSVTEDGGLPTTAPGAAMTPVPTEPATAPADAPAEAPAPADEGAAAAPADAAPATAAIPPATAEPGGVQATDPSAMEGKPKTD